MLFGQFCGASHTRIVCTPLLFIFLGMIGDRNLGGKGRKRRSKTTHKKKDVMLWIQFFLLQPTECAIISNKKKPYHSFKNYSPTNYNKRNVHHFPRKKTTKTKKKKDLKNNQQMFLYPSHSRHRKDLRSSRFRRKFPLTLTSSHKTPSFALFVFFLDNNRRRLFSFFCCRSGWF